MNQIDKQFQELRDRGARAFIPYVCTGDPTPELTLKLFLTLEEAGADLIKLSKRLLAGNRCILKSLARLGILKRLL